jgi:hypothetical protein
MSGWLVNPNLLLVCGLRWYATRDVFTGCAVVAALSFIVATGVDGRLSLLRGGGMVDIPTGTKA